MRRSVAYGSVLCLLFCVLLFGGCAPKEEEGPSGAETATGDDETGALQNTAAGTDGSSGAAADIVQDCDWNDPNGDDDDDGIPNHLEGCGDKDGDGFPNYLDHDSDGDGFLDSLEAGENPTSPQDSDEDGIPDFLDKDSDNDGLPDAQEANYGTDPTKKDTDGDGTDDLAEIVYAEENGSDPGEQGTDPTKKVPDGMFYVVLPYMAKEPAQRTLSFSTNIDAADVLIVLDNSGSMMD